ncbi:MAG: cytochrome c-type biogenesis protein CcmH [Firmicutes bacterium]|nr:cytochrome c-type biogenesis protein CcmH [Bacillota bacterium]
MTDGFQPWLWRHRLFRPAVLLLALLVFLLAGAGTEAQRSEPAKALSKKLMCLCGCNQILGECNHIGCTVSTEMLNKLDERVARNEPADLILQSFVQEYGLQVLAEPPTTGVSRWAWLMPPLAWLAGVGILIAVLWRWRAVRAAPSARGPALSSEALARARQQAAQETETDF